MPLPADKAAVLGLPQVPCPTGSAGRPGNGSRTGGPWRSITSSCSSSRTAPDGTRPSALRRTVRGAGPSSSPTNSVGQSRARARQSITCL